jgi:hypothetical protein
MKHIVVSLSLLAIPAHVLSRSEQRTANKPKTTA